VIRNGQPSQTALTAAAARAAHLIVDDEPPIFSDTLAYQLLGSQAEELIGYHRAHGEHLVLSGARAAATTRSRYTEDRLTESLRQETADRLAQYVILGAGLDSFAYRSDLADQVRVFEVDHPATQHWKRQVLADAGIAMPDTGTFVPVDFETDSLADLLIANGFDPSHPAVVSWLGVTMYLTREAIGQTLAVIGGFAPGTEVIVDYMVPPGLRDEAGQAYVDLLGPVTAERGEPWLTFLGPDDMSVILEERGFEVIEHVQQRDAIDPALWKRSDPLRASKLSFLTRASVRKPG
jgi:methyltransferase (TIGR00027 family)